MVATELLSSLGFHTVRAHPAPRLAFSFLSIQRLSAPRFVKHSRKKPLEPTHFIWVFIWLSIVMACWRWGRHAVVAVLLLLCVAPPACEARRHRYGAYNQPIRATRSAEPSINMVAADQFHESLEGIEEDVIAAASRGPRQKSADWPPRWAPVPVVAATLWWCSQW